MGMENLWGNERNRTAFFVCLVGMLVDLCCGGLKIWVGWQSGFISVMGDGLNGITDMGAVFLLLCTFYWASRPSDRKHPFGYGRLEYINATVMSALVLYVGITVLSESVRKMITPQPTEFHFMVTAVLLTGIGGKLFLTWWYTQAAKRLKSKAFYAYSADSLSDILATGGVLVATGAEYFFQFHIDGAMGIVMSLCILYTGYVIMRGAVNSIIGVKPPADMFKRIQETAGSVSGVYGVHDVIVHDYGPGNQFVSAHIELDSRLSFMESHEKAEQVTEKLREELQVQSVVHADPKAVSNPKEPLYRKDLEAALYRTGLPLTYHDFFVTEKDGRVYLSFEVAPGDGCRESDEEMYRRIEKELKGMDEKYEIEMFVDRNFISGKIYGVHSPEV